MRQPNEDVVAGAQVKCDVIVGRYEHEAAETGVRHRRVLVVCRTNKDSSVGDMT